MKRTFEFIKHVFKLFFYERRIPKRIANSRTFCFFTFPWDWLKNRRKKERADAETFYLYLPSMHHRYLYQIAYFFSRLGPPVKLIRRQTLEDYANLYQEGRLIYDIPNLKVVPPPTRRVRAKAFVRSEEASDVLVEGIEKEITISDEVSRAGDRSSMLLPYAAYPAQYQEGHLAQLQAHRAATRSVRVFFAGATWYYEGRGEEVNRLFGKLTRLGALTALNERLGPHKRLTISTPQQRMATLHGENDAAAAYTNKLVLSTVKGLPGDWLRDLAQCDFFLCLPGLTIPVAHNIVEAMAVGSIPILSYPEWFSPPLKHEENCLVYDGEDGLVEAVEQALAMSAEEIAAMREHVSTYYDEHLRPERLAECLMNSPHDELTLYVITERVAAYEGLNDDSILFADRAPCFQYAEEAEETAHQRLASR